MQNFLKATLNYETQETTEIRLVFTIFNELHKSRNNIAKQYSKKVIHFLFVKRFLVYFL